MICHRTYTNEGSVTSSGTAVCKDPEVGDLREEEIQNLQGTTGMNSQERMKINSSEKSCVSKKSYGTLSNCYNSRKGGSEPGPIGIFEGNKNLSNEDSIKNQLPPKIQKIYSNFTDIKYLGNTGSCEAVWREKQEEHIIQFFYTTYGSDANENDKQRTKFIQDSFETEKLGRETVLTHTFEISGDKIAYAKKLKNEDKANDNTNNSDSSKVVLPKLAWCKRNAEEITYQNSVSQLTHDLPPRKDDKFADLFGFSLLNKPHDYPHIISSITSFEKSSFSIFCSETKKKTWGIEPTEGWISDIAFNDKINKFALLSIYKEVAYHLVDAKDRSVVKAPWQSHHDGDIVSMDFDPNGERIVTLDRPGTYLISDIKTNAHITHHKFDKYSLWNKCRWSPICNNKIAMTFYNDKVYLVDLEKSTQEERCLKEKDIETIFNMEWRPKGESIALSTNKGVIIYNMNHRDEIKIPESGPNIRTIKWSPCGNKLAMGSSDGTVKLCHFGQYSTTVEEVEGLQGTKEIDSVCFI